MYTVNSHAISLILFLIEKKVVLSVRVPQSLPHELKQVQETHTHTHTHGVEDRIPGATVPASRQPQKQSSPWCRLDVWSGGYRLRV